MKPSPILLPLSWVFRAGVGLKNLMYETGIAAVETLECPVVSVGNVSTGGTGKTPFVEKIVTRLKAMGRNPSVVSRGFGRTTKGFQVISNGHQLCAEIAAAGDEPALLARRLNGVPVVVDEGRARAGRKAVQMFHADVIVLDDGFQHRSLRRDCDIVLVTSQELDRGERLLPAGYFREPLASLSRADLIVVSKCRDLEDFRKHASSLNKRFSAPVIGARNRVSDVQRVDLLENPPGASLEAKSAVALSGIADPASFEKTLNDLGVRMVMHHRFPDHHWFTPEEIRTVLRSVNDRKAEILVTTEKDWIRLESEQKTFAGIPTYTIGIGTEIISGENDLIHVLKNL